MIWWCVRSMWQVVHACMCTHVRNVDLSSASPYLNEHTLTPSREGSVRQLTRKSYGTIVTSYVTRIGRTSFKLTSLTVLTMSLIVRAKQ